MKALVLSGGSGTRLRPFSHSMPKQLMPIANKPVLEHVLENIRDLGITEVGIIVGDRAPQIAEVMGDGSRLGIRVTYIPQEKPLGLAHCVMLARPFLGDDDFVMYLGDNMLPGGIKEVAEAFRTKRPAAEVVVHKVSDPRAFGVVELAPDGTVSRLVEKPHTPRSNLALIGAYFFTPAIHEAVASIEPSARGELEITDAIQWLVANGAKVRASEYLGYWKDTGQVADVLECNQTLLADLQPENLGNVDDFSDLGFRIRIEAGARVVRSRIDGPAVIGAGSIIEDCHIGPDTSIGSGCTLRATKVRDSIVMDGAEITGVHGLHHSLIGRNATVGTGPTGGSGHSLVVGDHTRIEVAA
ncbi:glucose-1-phosphate thymidylyltransferase [Streptomyces cyaneofuscatus]|uniref:glucose-1-phosphate thymidylyltransferase n=1 Tax=Streptomyces cyaneofuscatus TaxID=66883 RepID=UPI0036D0D86F